MKETTVRRFLSGPVLGIGTIGVLAVIALIMTLRPLVLSGTNDVTTIDFDDGVITEGVEGPREQDLRPALRVAVGAMNSPRATRGQYADLLRVVADAVDRRALLAQRKTYAEINDMLEQKQVDLAFVCTAPYVLGKKKFGMEILAVPVTQGQKVYYSYILAHLESSARSLDDLRGKVFAFTDPQSNTGCLVPKYMLLLRGETPKSFFGDYYFAYGHDNAIRAVAERLADGAAVDSLVWEYLNETDPTWTSRTRIIQRSPPYGIPPVVVHPDLNPELKDRLRQVFLDLHKDERAQKALHTLRIDRFEQEDDSAYESVREMFRFLEQASQQGS